MAEDIIAGLHRLERTILPLLQRYSSASDLINNSSLKEVEVLRALHWLKEKNLCEIKENSVELVELDVNGIAYRNNGLPEEKILRLVNKDPQPLSKLMQQLTKEEINVGIGLLKRSNLITIEKGDVKITTDGKEKLRKGFDENKLLQHLEHPKKLIELNAKQKEIVKKLSERGILKTSVKKVITATYTEKGKKIASDNKLKQEVVDRLTPEMIKSGKTQNLRSYNLKASVPKIFFGKKQPYRRFLDEVRQKLVSLGFEEMSGPIVESEFWNMDALFMPQFHSARDIHDAYYVKSPRYATNLPKDLVAKVKAAHEHGTKGSKGWNYKFDEKKTARLILRSHDTSISPRILSSKELKIPGKYFQIARCFRYDVIDATHNADFDQIGGFVVDKDLNLKHLFGVLRMFAKEFCNTDQIKVVPSYFPFTEPSASLYAKHPVMGWIELAGSGIFRPEMTEPLGIKHPVIAWGIGLGRVAMFNLGIKDIRQLYSHDLAYLRNAKCLQ